MRGEGGADCNLTLLLLEHYFGHIDIFSLAPYNLLRWDFTVPAIETPTELHPHWIAIKF